MYRPKTVFIYPFDQSFDRRAVEKVNKNCIWSLKDEIIPIGCPVMLNYQLEIVGDKSLTFIDHYDEFYVNLGNEHRNRTPRLALISKKIPITQKVSNLRCRT